MAEDEIRAAEKYIYDLLGKNKPSGFLPLDEKSNVDQSTVDDVKRLCVSRKILEVKQENGKDVYDASKKGLEIVAFCMAALSYTEGTLDVDQEDAAIFVAEHYKSGKRISKTVLDSPMFKTAYVSSLAKLKSY